MFTLGKLRHGTPGSLMAPFFVLCALAMVLAACGSGVTTATPGGAATAPLGPGSSIITAGPSRLPSGMAVTPAASGAARTQAPNGPAATPAPSAMAPTAAPTDGVSNPPPSVTSAFTLLRMANAADASKPAPDSTTFTDTFPTSAPALYVVFALSAGLTGQVSCSVTANGVRLVQPLNINYGSKNSWGDFKVRSRGSFVKGDYVATVTYVPTGEAASIAFTVK